MRQLGTHLLHVADSLLHPRFESLHAAALILNSLLRRGDNLQQLEVGVELPDVGDEALR